MGKRIETPYGAAEQHDNGILEYIFEGELTDLKRMKENNEFVEKHFETGKNTLLLVDMKKVTKTTKEVRNVSNDDGTESAALALLVGGGLSRIVGNLFISFNKPSYPTKIFTNREKAIQWLLTHKK